MVTISASLSTYSPKSQDTTGSVVKDKSNTTVVQLPAISEHSSITAKPLLPATPANEGKPHPLTPVSTSRPVSGTVVKLPPLGNVSNGSRTKAILTPSHSSTSATPPFRLPTRSQLKLTRHSSTFKGTPLGYRQYLRKETKEEDLGLAESADEGSLRVSFSGHLDTFTASDTSTASAERLGEGISDHSPISQGSAEWDTQTHTVSSSLPEDQDKEVGQETGGAGEEVGEETGGAGQEVGEVGDQRRLVNQVERFERLMKVLSLLKGASGMESLEVVNSEEELDIHDIKEHIKLALDEAVQLRMETTAMQRRIGVSSSTDSTNVLLLTNGEGNVRTCKIAVVI